MQKSVQKVIYNVPIFKKIKRINKIDGGITNQNFMVTNHRNKNYFVRICKDIPEHLIKREIEIKQEPNDSYVQLNRTSRISEDRHSSSGYESSG